MTSYGQQECNSACQHDQISMEFAGGLMVVSLDLLHKIFTQLQMTSKGRCNVSDTHWKISQKSETASRRCKNAETLFSLVSMGFANLRPIPHTESLDSKHNHSVFNS